MCIRDGFMLVQTVGTTTADPAYAHHCVVREGATWKQHSPFTQSSVCPHVDGIPDHGAPIEAHAPRGHQHLSLEARTALEFDQVVVP
eukprot:TRINITY_DN20656_c0_g1_i1.p2 TRINITY_DN20656_c0_g1~~TRINITY_DN20656_c0_g1_i1.p2  ORF type:complete len:100 (-),score=32.65 TRINITY_DN20656_c0_g1_i1:13-273(-)